MFRLNGSKKLLRIESLHDPDTGAQTKALIRAYRPSIVLLSDLSQHVHRIALGAEDWGGVDVACVYSPVRTSTAFSDRFSQRSVCSQFGRFHYVPTTEDGRALVSQGVPRAHIFVLGNSLFDGLQVLRDTTLYRGTAEEQFIAYLRDGNNQLVVFAAVSDTKNLQRALNAFDGVSVRMGDRRHAIVLYMLTTKKRPFHRLDRMGNVRLFLFLFVAFQCFGLGFMVSLLLFLRYILYQGSVSRVSPGFS